jgi:hypothetical protein
VEHDQPGLGGSGAAGQGWGPAWATGVAPVGVGRGVGRGRGRGAWKRYEREKWEKERAGLGTIPAYVYRADTSVDEHKWADLRGGRGALCSSVISYIRRFLNR